MIELYRNGSEQLILNLGTSEGPVDADALPTVSIYDGETGDLISGPDTSTRIDVGTYGYNTPLSLSQTERTLRAVWAFTIGGESGTWEQFIQVVTPYVTPSAVKDRFPDNSQIQSLSYEQLKDTEKLIRHIINAFTGQEFNLETNETYEVRGRGLEELYLPKRLIRLTYLASYDGRMIPAEVNPRTNASLRRTHKPVAYSQPQTVGATMYGVPANWFQRVDKWGDSLYYVTGDWGWERVPSQVTEAALLLVRDYFCSDSKYFEMYVDNIRASDWRMEFARTGDATTGNAKADMLLKPLRRSNITIL